MAVSAPVLRRALKARSPSLAIERALWDAGQDVVVGVDEVGRGAWAGPLSVGAAVLPRDRRVYKVRDSKLLTEVEREALFDRIAGWCRAWAVGHASHEECDALGMADAQRLAARRAIDGLGLEPDHVVVDGNWDFVGGGRTQRLVRADAVCLSVAAASILAKVTRDRLMRAQAVHFPGYDFDLNKGYPCPRHKLALAAMGPTSIHRRAWVFMDHLPWTALHRLTPDVAPGSTDGYRGAMTDAETPEDPEVPTDQEVPDDERLERVQDDIDHARKTAEDADVLIDPDEPRFYKSGDEADEDDQTIDPPG
jgi:ribonuclease HII